MNARNAWMYKYDGRRMSAKVDNIFDQGFHSYQRVGVRLNKDESSIYFFLDGKLLGKAFDDLPSNQPLYPFVSIGNSRVAVKIEICSKDAENQENFLSTV